MGSAGEHRILLTNLVLDDLLGPASGPDEELGGNGEDVRPSDRYLVGMLAPRGTSAEPEKDENLATAGAAPGDDGHAEGSVAPSESMLPSSFGLTFSVGADVDAVVVSASWGRYERTTKEKKDDESDQEGPTRVWKRHPVVGTPTVVPLKPGKLEPFAPFAEQPDVRVHGVVRRRDHEWIVSLFLVNEQTEPDRSKDEAWIFQPELVVEGTDGSAPFLRRPILRTSEHLDPESQRESAELAMLYRNDVEFAAGHGVAVHAETSPEDPSRAIRIRTRFLPCYEVPQQTPPNAADPGFEKLADLVLDMKALAETRDGFAPKLAPLADAYADWIERQRARIDNPATGLAPHHAAARRALDRCGRTLERIRAGIGLLDSDENAADAFRFANDAMCRQRVRSMAAEAVRRGEETDADALAEELMANPIKHSWYPFQLAFVLINLPGLTDLGHADRSEDADATADLLWFPTGGGKTEAYLGLTAYTLAIRRLQGVVEGRPGDAGVAVLMRYTLRLLTLQQFQRASALICACETIRHDDTDKWGDRPFRIGLWVGMRTTPNSTDQAAEAIKAAHGREGQPVAFGATGTPAQLTNCPWCGAKILPGRDIVVETGLSRRNRTLTYCSDPLGSCPFTRAQAPGEGIPVVVVDEEIYRLLPSLVIATVDKFAQMPWDGRTQMLFGQVDSLCPRHGFRTVGVEDSDSHPKSKDLQSAKTIGHPDLRPPDLIIQDELHLISGPLGSLVGIYETVIDEMCSWEVAGKRIRPKLVASTATIRNALSQVNRLFLREVSVFPPPGLDITDNFFSIRREPSPEQPGRLYVGICAPGKRLKAALIRVYIALLGGAQKLYDEHGTAVDPWMTLVGYFNSLRELGGMRRLVDDDIRTRLRRISMRGLGDRHAPSVEELTSRKSSTDIPDVLDRMEIGFDPKDDEIRKELRKQDRPLHKKRPIDVLLATNMLSVGVDVKRLGLMVIGGQPKTTAEYIQATSRVGRHFPGLVCTVYNWARPRDLSHYERFEHYHATFYERVESLSVTPFAARALDRALSALFVSLVRLAGPELNGNEGASRAQRDHAFVQRAVEAIARRAELVMSDQNLGDEVRSMLRQRLDEWLSQAQRTAGHLGYAGKRDGITVPLLRKPGDRDWATFTCLNSLRDVEAQSGFILVDDALGGDAPLETKV